MKIASLDNNHDTRGWVSICVNCLVFIFSVGILGWPDLYGLAAFGFVILGFVVIAPIGQRFLRPDVSWNDKIFISLVSLFFVVLLVGVLFQPEPFLISSLDQQLTALDYPSRWILLIPAYLLFRRHRVDWRAIAVGLSVGCLVAVSVAHYQVYYMGLSRASGFATHTISFAELMVVTDFFLWIFMIRAWSEGRRLLSVILFAASLLAFYGSLLSVTRGAWLAYAFAVVIWIVYLFGSGIRRGGRSILGPVIWRLSFGLLLFLIVSQTSQYQTIAARTGQTIQAIENEDYISASSRRFETWAVAFQTIGKYPFGVGTENFSRIGTEFSHAHNELINVAVENGVQGVLAFLALLGFTCFLFLRAVKSENPDVRLYASLGLALLTSYAVFAQTQALLSHHDTLLFFIVFLYLFFAQIERHNEVNGCKPTQCHF